MDPHCDRPGLGRHVLVDFHEAAHLCDAASCVPVLRRAAEAAGATVLDVALRDFGHRAGYTGVALLAESHISIHTWPEHGLAVLDIFMCGACDPMAALPVLRAHFRPGRETVTCLRRGAAVSAGAA
nr:adenosylmethionine decarboxylase [Jannaschia sp. S6380]